MIRQITMQDLDAIYELNARELGASTDYDSLRETLERIILLPQQHYLIGYEYNGRLVGYAHAQLYEMLYSENILLNIISMAVSGEVQGQGVGRQLIQAVEQVSYHLGLDGIRINSGYNREGAHVFYEKLGYVSTRDQKRYVKLFKNALPVA